MAGELRSALSDVSWRLPDPAAGRKSGDFKTGALPEPVTAGLLGTGVTPRKYIKVLHHVVSILDKHKSRLGAELAKALKDLEELVKEAARSYSSAASGKIHYYLMEDYQLQKLHAAADLLQGHISSVIKVSAYGAPDFQADIADAVSKLSSNKCSLQASQLQLIDEFKAVASTIDPSANISDSAQKIAEQVVRKVIAEVHGPFFNAEILEKEISHLEKVAAYLNPDARRYEAACVKLLASTLMSLDGEEPADDDCDSLAQGSVDPFLIPSFAPVTMRLVDPRLAAVRGESGISSECSTPRGLTIQVAGDGGLRTASGQLLTDLETALQQQQQQADTVSPVAPSAVTPLSPLTPTAEAAPQTSNGDARLQQTAMWQLGQQQKQEDGDSNVGAAGGAAAPHKLLEQFIDSNTAFRPRDSRKSCMFHAEMRLAGEGVQKLANFLQTTGRVRGLSLAHNQIGPQGIQLLCEAMAVNKSVKTLDLTDNQLGDEGAVTIAQLMIAGGKITSLQLSHNDIGDKGLIALSEAISRTKILERLSIYNNNVTSVGCAALTAAVAANPNLKLVEFLPGNAAHTKDIKALARAVKQNRKFKIFNLFGKQSAT